MFGSPAGSGVLAIPPTATNPLQNPLAAQPMNQAAGLEAANAQERLKRNALQQAIFKAMALREQPNYAKGAGPLGIRIGEGPGGWAVSIGDLIAGLSARGKQNKATGEVTGGMGDLAPAENATNTALNAVRRQFIPQGSPLSLSDY